MVLIVAKRFLRTRRLATTIFKLVPHLDPATPNKVSPAKTQLPGVFAVLELSANLAATLFPSE
jgi:hypothetical protein